MCDAIQPMMTHLVPLAAGIVERRGGMLIHGAIIAREMQIPGNPQDAERCLECHTTGAGELPGRFMESFDVVQGVQCESCHGAGSEYMPEAVMLDPVGVVEAGLQEVGRQTCARCHTPGIHGHEFDFGMMWNCSWRLRKVASISGLHRGSDILISDRIEKG